MSANVRTLELYASEGLERPEKIASISYDKPGDPPLIVHHERQLYVRANEQISGGPVLYELEVPFGAESSTYLGALFDLEELVAVSESVDTLAVAAFLNRLAPSRAELLAAILEGYAKRMAPAHSVTETERAALADGLEKLLEKVREIGLTP